VCYIHYIVEKHTISGFKHLDVFLPFSHLWLPVSAEIATEVIVIAWTDIPACRRHKYREFARKKPEQDEEHE
jgi:hypothetical protein